MSDVRALAVCGALAAVTALGCAAPPQASEPPDIRFGFDTCERCRMSIDDPRYAAAARFDGEALAFDDLGDLVAYLEESGRQPEAVWVHDFESGEWLAAESAWFVRSQRLATPMGFGTVAFASASEARRMAENTGGRVLVWRELRAGAETATTPTR